MLIRILVLLTISASAWATPDIEQWQTGNGSKVLFVAAPELPMIDIQIIFDAGSARDGKSNGVSMMTNAIMPEGAGKWNADQLAERIEDVGAELGNSAHRDMFVMSIRSLTEKELLDQAVSTLTTILNEPTFPKDAFERERKRVLVALEQQEQSPDAIAEKAFYQTLYADHPYANMPEGNKQSLEKLTTADLKKFYQQYIVASNAVVAIVGAVDTKKAKQLAESIVGKLPKGKKPAPIPPVADLSGAVTKRIDFPSSQTHLMIGQPGMKRQDKDYFALYLGNHALGGSGLVSIISDEIREKRGLAYSSYSYFSPMREAGPFIMGMQTRNDKADEALTVSNDVLKAFVKDGPTAKQLDASKQNVIGGFAQKTDSNKKVLGYLGMIGFYDMPLDYLDTFIKQVESTSLADVKRAFKQRLNPDKMVTVIVGGNESPNGKN